MTTEQTVQTATEQSSAATESSFTVPEAYASKGWAEKIKSNDDVWKLLDNSQQLIGKRPAGIPDQNASDEDWEKFYSVFRPESPDKYSFPDVEGLPEGMDIAPYKDMAMNMFHDAGLNQKQAEKLWKSYVGSEVEAATKGAAAAKEQQTALDKQFDELTGKMFGGQYEQVAKGAQDFIRSALPDELKPVIGQIADNPAHLAAMIKIADHAQKQIAEVKKKYGAEDSLASGTQTGGMSRDEVVKKLTEANIKAKGADPFSMDRKTALEDVEKFRSLLVAMSK